MKIPLLTLKGYVVRKWKPLVQQVKDWMDSYWHKDELIPVESVDGLAELINAMPSQATLDALLEVLLPYVLNLPQTGFYLEAGKNIYQMRFDSTEDVTVTMTDGDTSEDLFGGIEVKAMEPLLYDGKVAAPFGAGKMILISGMTENTTLRIWTKS